MYVLPFISHILWMHVEGLTILGHNQYTSARILFIQASDHPSFGTRFGENCKITKPSSGSSMLLSEDAYDIDALPQSFCMFYVCMCKV